MQTIIPYQEPCQTAIFPLEPDPPIESVGSLADQFRVIGAFLAIPDPIRERDPDLCWSVVCGVVEHQKGGQR